MKIKENCKVYFEFCYNYKILWTLIHYILFLKFYLFSNVKITLNPIVEIILVSTIYVICILEIFNQKLWRILENILVYNVGVLLFHHDGIFKVNWLFNKHALNVALVVWYTQIYRVCGIGLFLCVEKKSLCDECNLECKPWIVLKTFFEGT